MSKYWAQMGPNSVVLHVVVCDTKEWLEKNIGGEWVETFVDHATEKYAGRLMHDTANIAKEKFVHAWTQPGIEGYPKGAKVWHIGHGWLSLVNQNTSEPDTGSSQWRDYSVAWPPWSASGTNYLKDERVAHKGGYYRSLTDGNAGEPGRSTNWQAVIGDGGSGEPDPKDYPL